MNNINKLFLMSALGLTLSACGGSSSNDSSSNNSTPPPNVPSNPDLFTQKAKLWEIKPESGKDYCYDIDTQSSIDCNQNGWDLKFAQGARTPTLFTNSGVSGAGKGGVLYSPFSASWSTLSKDLNATQNGQVPSAAWLVDAYGNAFTEKTDAQMVAFFEYDLFGDHRMSPNFKTYLVTNNTASAERSTYAVQIINYYQGSTSGHISLRYIDIAQPEDVRILNIDATQSWVYVDLKSGSVSNASNLDWQIAFNRYNVQINDAAGSYVASQPAGFYDADGKVILTKFKDANAVQDTVADLKAAAGITVNDRNWKKNSVSSILNPTYQGTYPNKLSYGWYSYYPTDTAAKADGLEVAHTLKANPDAASVIRSNTGESYARFHLKEIKYLDPKNSASQSTWTFEFDIQPKS